MTEYFHLLIYLLPMAGIWLAYVLFRALGTRGVLHKEKQVLASGLTEPASLHPVIDPAICMGCGACVYACPEGKILGLVRGKARLVEPANCIGHGACQAACPFDAITLVFGSAQRGVDIPLVSPEFETAVEGLYIAGELGGMGLIRNAMTQGVQAVEAIKRSANSRSKSASVAGQELLDLVVIGAGPAGIAASLTAKAENLSHVVIEQNELGGTVAHFPRNKIDRQTM